MDVQQYIVLLSGGLDSVTNLYWAQREGRVAKALTFDYGQRSRASEIRASSFFCKKLNVPLEVIELPWLKALTHTALVDVAQNLPHLQELDDLQQARQTAKAVWVPNRNGVFLNIAAAYAESMGVEFVIPGFNKEEASSFPDNSPAFIEATTHSLSLSTLSQVKVACFTSGLDKIEMVKKAQELGVEFSALWSCYQGGEVPCGQCESCQRSLRAFKACGIAF